MADEELLEEEHDDDILSDVHSDTGMSKLMTTLIWIGGIIAGILLMVIISYLMAKRVRTEAYKEDQNIVIAPAPPPLYTFKFQEEFRVNTADVDESHFIQLSLSFAFDPDNKQLESELIQRQSQMMHIINLILGGKKKEDLATQQQKINLEEEIKAQINMILREGKIEAVYFEQLVVS